MKYDFLSIGAAVSDIFVFLKEEDSLVIENPKREPTRRLLLALEYGAKIGVAKSARAVGGGAANSATAFSRLGFKAAVLAAVGQDRDGKNIIAELRQEGVVTALIGQDRARQSGFSIIIIPAGGRDHAVIVERGASENLDLSARALASASVLYLTALCGDWRGMLDKITRAGRASKRKLIWNPGAEQLSVGLGGLGKYIRQTDIFTVNRDEALSLVGGDKKGKAEDRPEYLLESILAWGAKAAVITDGARGVYYGDEKNKYFMAADQGRQSVESTGAGDAFGSGFAAGLSLTGWKNIPLALDLGIANSESVIGQIGSRQGILRKKDLAKILGKKNHTLKEL